jgi:molecular chaperone GrpE
MAKKELNTKKVDELTDLLKRVQAEFENFRRRKESEIEEIKSCSNEVLIKKLLDILDNFNLALASKESENLRKGVELIYSQLLNILESEGLKLIPKKGEFDPNLHEAIAIEESELKENQIIETYQTGYQLGNKIIRHAKVKVSKKK